MHLSLQLFVQTHADVLGLDIILPKESESVLLGSAMLAASAALKAQEELQVPSSSIHNPDKSLHLIEINDGVTLKIL